MVETIWYFCKSWSGVKALGANRKFVRFRFLLCIAQSEYDPLQYGYGG